MVWTVAKWKNLTQVNNWSLHKPRNRSRQSTTYLSQCSAISPVSVVVFSIAVRAWTCTSLELSNNLFSFHPSRGIIICNGITLRRLAVICCWKAGFYPRWRLLSRTLSVLDKIQEVQKRKLWLVKQEVTLQTKNNLNLKWELETRYTSTIPKDFTVNFSADVFLLTDFQHFDLHVVFISQKRWGKGVRENFLSTTPSASFGTQRQIPRPMENVFFFRYHDHSLLSVRSHTVTVQQLMRIRLIREDYSC